MQKPMATFKWELGLDFTDAWEKGDYPAQPASTQPSKDSLDLSKSGLLFMTSSTVFVSISHIC